jgi:hypothetical protein
MLKIMDAVDLRNELNRVIGQLEVVRASAQKLEQRCLAVEDRTMAARTRMVKDTVDSIIGAIGKTV